MKLLKLSFDHVRMFEDGIFNFDCYTTDRVPSSDKSAFELSKPVYSNNIIAFAGINASGKTTALKLLFLTSKIINGELLGGSLAPMAHLFDGPTTFRCAAWHAGDLYIVESVLEPCVNADTGQKELAFREEIVRKLPGRKLKKSMLASWEELLSASDVLGNRSEMDSAWAALTGSRVSVAQAFIAGDIGTAARVPVAFDEVFRLDAAFAGLDDILRVFDSNISHLEVRDGGRAFELYFLNERKPLVLSERGLAEVLSSGTVRGLGLVRRSISALKSGGYLLVDEIENHLNRQLVNVVVDLFASSETNPFGATLVFTTHYPQLLDHIHRKDNVYFLVRNEKRRTEVVKYGDKVKRIENKKSEVFFSNFIKGTAPRYSEVKALRDLVGGAVADGK